MLGHGGATCASDLIDDFVRDTRIRPVTVHGSAKVVDHDRSAPSRELNRIQAADASTRSRHDDDLSIEVDHVRLPASTFASGTRWPKWQSSASISCAVCYPRSGSHCTPLICPPPSTKRVLPVT